jgi:hypothetical protein
MASPVLFLIGFSERNRLPKEGKKHIATVDTGNAIDSISYPVKWVDPCIQNEEHLQRIL